MTAAAWICSGLALAFMTIDWWSVSTGRPRVEQVAKPAVMVALIAVASTADVVPSSLLPWIVAGLALGLVGDVLLLPRFDHFIGGLIAFLLGHLAYVVGFLTIWSLTPWLALGVASFAGLVVGFAAPIDRALRGSPLRPAVAAYIAVTGAVLISGAATGRWPIVVGTLAFAASDGLLGADRFLEPTPERRVWVHVLYQLGQAGIVAGAIAA